MRLSINQPCYLPWCGLFERISRSDLHIHLDDVQYSKNTFFNRNRILDNSGREVMLTIPVSAGLSDTFLTVKTADQSWRRKHERTLNQCFPRNPTRSKLLDEMHELYTLPFANLAEINIAFTEWIARALGIGTPMVRSSTMNIGGGGTERLIEMCKTVGADRYYSPSGARDYLDPSLFSRADIVLEYQHYEPVPYPQTPTGSFVPFLSVIDVLLRHGVETALRIVSTGGGAPEIV